jgi:hypothetical protein
MSIIHGDVRDAITTDTPRYGRTVSGYGGKVPTAYKVRLTDDPTNGPWRRVYAMVYGNSGSLYVTRHGGTIFLSDPDLAVALGR